MMMMIMMMMMMMMMMCKQGFRVRTIFQKREQFGGYHRLILLQNVPTLDIAGTLAPPVL